jgi:hypothetical protein
MQLKSNYMNTNEPGPSASAGSISKAISLASSSRAGASASKPFEGWLLLGTAAVDQSRAVVIEAAHGKISLNLDSGQCVEIFLKADRRESTVFEDLLLGRSIAPHVKFVSISS